MNIDIEDLDQILSVSNSSFTEIDSDEESCLQSESSLRGSDDSFCSDYQAEEINQYNYSNESPLLNRD